MKSVLAISPLAIAAAAVRFVFTGLLLAAPDVAAAGDAKAGEAFFSHCAACHSTSPGVNKIGPSLAGIVGSQSGAVPGFNFSPAMKNAKVTWDEKSLDRFLQNPNGFIAGTRMFFTVPKESDRQNVIAYLETLKH